MTSKDVLLPNESESLFLMLKDEDPNTRERAAYALGRATPDTSEVMLALGEALSDHNDDVCVAAAISLFLWGGRSSAALPLLVNAIHHRDTNVKCLVIGTLGAIGPEARDAAPEIVKELNSPDLRTRCWSKEALRLIEQHASELGIEGSKSA
jgi:HEAT repeat protein